MVDTLQSTYPLFQIFLYVCYFLAAVHGLAQGLGLFVKQQGVADALPADTPSTYQVGARVELVGLKNASLNGATGHVLKMRWVYSQALYGDPGASLDDLCEAVTTLEDTARIARRVLGGEHPLTTGVEKALGKSRAAYDTRRGVLEALAGGHGVDLETLRQTYRA